MKRAHSREESFLEGAARTTLGEQIREARKGLSWTPTILATEAGVSAGHLSQIEKSRIFPKVDTILRLSKALETPLVISYEAEEAYRKEAEAGDQRHAQGDARLRSIPPKEGGPWVNVASLAAELGLSENRVRRVLADAGVKRYRGRNDTAVRGSWMKRDEALRILCKRKKIDKSPPGGPWVTIAELVERYEMHPDYVRIKLRRAGVTRHGLFWHNAEEAKAAMERNRRA